MSETAQRIKPISPWMTTLICAMLLCGFALASWSAVSTKNATGDEPLHVTGGFVRFFHADFRVNFEDPPLWIYWAMLPHNRQSLKIDTRVPAWDEMLAYPWRQWSWCGPMLYRMGNDAERFVNRSRAMMLIVGVTLGATMIAWAWRLAGALAAISAAVLYTFDPNFLGHAPLVKNDIAMTVVTLAAAFATWSVGIRARSWNVLLLAMLVGSAINTKYSGLLVPPIVAFVLGVRALMPHPWQTPFGLIRSPARKLTIVAAILFVCAGGCFAITWACYGFRFAPTKNPNERFDVALVVEAAVHAQMRAAGESRELTEAEQQRFREKPLIRTVLRANEHRVLPHAWLIGLLDTYATTRSRNAYLIGEIRATGWWYYFPLAMLFKTPTVTLAAIFFTAVAAIVVVRKRIELGIDRWTLACITIPAVIYGAAAMTANVNLGLRHFLPVYPFLYLLVAITVARVASARPRIAVAVGMLCSIVLAIESVSAHPNYIAFFNVPSGGARGGIRLLGDSNLDWGQDLKLLASWQRANPRTRLYLSYFGGADPDYYLQDYIPLPGNMAYTKPQAPDTPGIAAISATNLQGIYLAPDDAALYRELMRRQQPIEVLGGTIYLYEVKP